MKIRYDFFKEVMQGKYNKYYILNTTNGWNDLPSYQNSVSGAYLYGDFFFLQHQFKSKELGHGWGTRPLKLPVNVRKTHPCASFIKITF